MQAQHGPKTAQLFQEVVASARHMASLPVWRYGVIRKLYTKSKHGFVLVRSAQPGGPPFFGANGRRGHLGSTG